MAKQKVDAYKVITDKVIAMLETHGSGWTKPWSDSLAGAPVSLSTGNPYRGINRLLLGLEGRSDTRWGTYKAWSEKGGQVRKGEKGTAVIFFKPLEIRGDDGEVEKKIPFARIYNVFNAEQVDGIELIQPEEFTPIELDQRCEDFVAATAAQIRFGGDSAFYSPVVDYIGMPRSEAFETTAGYYGVLLHELTHWTGHSTRCDRKILNSFGNEEYAFEELVAELGATFLCADLGIEIEPREDHAQYIASWLKALRNDKKLIVKAAKQAQLASEFLHGLQDDNQLAEAA